MTTAPAFTRYRWDGGEEWMMRFGPADGPVVALALPLFEEANRTRAVAGATLRALADHGVAGALPELPGLGESLVSTQATTLRALRDAFAGAVGAIGAERRVAYVASVRSGALIDAAAPARARWRLAPQDGRSLLRELTRIKQQEARGRTLGERWWSGGAVVSVAGNLIAPDLLDELAGATPHDAPARTVRLEADPRPADRHLPGAPPWRRAEPGGDDALARAFADDIVEWVRTCVGR